MTPSPVKMIISAVSTRITLVNGYVVVFSGKRFLFRFQI